MSSLYLILLLFFVSFCSCALAFLSAVRRNNFRATTRLTGIKGFRGWFESQFPDAIIGFSKHDSHDTFDHVLIDMNQLLHICVRKAKSEGHGLILLMKELDAVLAMATPTQSLVLAMDGPPSAAKLATQRKRRYSTLQKTSWKLAQLQELGILAKRLSGRQLARKRRRTAAETRTLCITPGTLFMQRAEKAIRYWAWQRLSSRNSILHQNNVKIYLSPSTVPGEGEVKLLEWLYQVPSRKGASVAILGGDSDLVLEGLVIPPSSTHNVVCLLPDGPQQYLCVSCWDTTRALAKLVHKNVVHVRTDLTVLLILNGNDYLPKLRGSSGFQRLFQTYVRLMKDWKDTGYIVHPQTLAFHSDFCIDLFSRLASSAPPVFDDSNSVDDESSVGYSSLSRLHNLVDAGYLPRPMAFQVVDEEEEWMVDAEDEINIRDDDEDHDEEVLDGNDDEEDVDEPDVECRRVRLLLGEPGSEDFSSFEIWHPKSEPIKFARQKLANMALAELAGLEEEEESPMSTPSYEWELPRAVEGKVDRYLYGLLWNLQTYQDGVCADYAFNYGKRHAPSANDIVKFFRAAKRDNRTVDIHALSGNKPYSPPISAGVSSLAALPTEVKELVPEPYCRLADETVESIYAECMSSEDNVFDMKRFESLCEQHVAAIQGNTVTMKDDEYHNGRHISTGDHFWTVISRVPKALSSPFESPPPFSDRLSKLRPNNKIRMSRLVATKEPRPRSCWIGTDTNRRTERRRRGSQEKIFKEMNHTTLGPLFEKYQNIEDVSYKIPYQLERERGKKKKTKLKITFRETEMRQVVKVTKENDISKQSKGHHELEQNANNEFKQAKSEKTFLNDVDRTAHRESFHLQLPPRYPLTTVDGHTALACLKQLEDAEFIGSIEWTITVPSTSEYAAFDPNGHELIRLSVKRSSNFQKNVMEHEICYEQDREVKSMSRKTIQQHLASLALGDITGPEMNWSTISFKELKEFLGGKKTKLA